MEQVLQALSKLRIGVAIEEQDIQLEIAQVFSEADIPYCREYKLGPGNRIDFLTQSGIGVEVKKAKPNRTRLVDQINRYAEYKKVKAVVIVVETSLRIPVTKTANGKPCTVLGLQKLWGIAL